MAQDQPEVGAMGRGGLEPPLPKDGIEPSLIPSYPPTKAPSQNGGGHPPGLPKQDLARYETWTCPSYTERWCDGFNLYHPRLRKPAKRSLEMMPAAKPGLSVRCEPACLQYSTSQPHVNPWPSPVIFEILVSRPSFLCPLHCSCDVRSGFYFSWS